MKKTLYLLGLLALASCQQPQTDSKPAANELAQQAKSALKDITLNGLTFKQADEMVRRFIKSNQSSAPVTSFWFSEDFLDAMNMVLANEQADGVRIYFAKDSNDKNTIVMVSTRAELLSGKPIHKEYFSRKTTLLDAAYATAEVSYDQPKGADLYTLTSYPQSCPHVSSHYLSPEQSAKWVQKFRDDQPAGSPLKINTSSVWYSRGIFRELKSLLQQANDRQLRSDGFRIYVMRKDDVMQTVSFVMIPTIADQADDKIHKDYYDCLDKINMLPPPPVDNGHECPSFCDDGATWGLPDSTKTTSKKPGQK